MMRTIFSIFLLFSFMLAGGSVLAQFVKPKTYQECLLGATWSGVANSANRKLIENQCRQQFPKTAPSYQSMSVKLNEQSLSNINIYPKRSAKNTVEAAIYNGNTDVTITQLTVLLTPITARDSMDDFFDSEEYEINLEIGPTKTAAFKIDQDTAIKGRFRWKILHGLGY